MLYKLKKQQSQNCKLGIKLLFLIKHFIFNYALQIKTQKYILKIKKSKMQIR